MNDTIPSLSTIFFFSAVLNLKLAVESSSKVIWHLLKIPIAGKYHFFMQQSPSSRIRIHDGPRANFKHPIFILFFIFVRV